MNERGRVVGRTADTDRSADGHRSWVHDNTINRKPQRSRVPASVIIVIIIMLTG